MADDLPRADAPRDVTQTVADDMAADTSGTVRPETTPLPPPGTEWQGFWMKSATHAAIVVTVGLGLMFARAAIMGEPVSREGLAVAVEGVVWAWLAALGIRAIGGRGIQEK